MKLLASFAALLIALQVVAAVHSDQLQQPRFVKVKRTVSRHADSHKAYRLGANLEKRDLKPFLAKVEELKTLYNAGQDAPRQDQLLREIKKQASALGFMANPEVAARHGLKPPSESVHRLEGDEIAPVETSRAGEERGQGHFTRSQAWLDNQNRLAGHEKILDGHRELLDANHEANFLAHQRIGANTQAIREVSKKVQKTLRGRRAKNTLLWTTLAGTTALGTVTTLGMMSDYSKINAQKDDINRLSQEVARLKAQNGQMATSVTGPGGAVQQGAPASSQQGLV
ncbi:conserved hypothetical protein [Sporisorium reilianum SRZ2]|uniref:Uncharacterized protein n=1 Tax=Sporisorium reilianum (strain SRZ2) TaxID=999809 RepID=E6ZL79_SPORE|nr:conserved hypothetical protein [Sporisorium reilianum SRZ2]